MTITNPRKETCIASNRTNDPHFQILPATNWATRAKLEQEHQMWVPMLGCGMLDRGQKVQVKKGAFSSFPTMFSTLFKTNFANFSHI